MYCFSGDTADLVVKYDVGRDAIYSVKWYKVGIRMKVLKIILKKLGNSQLQKFIPFVENVY